MRFLISSLLVGMCLASSVLAAPYLPLVFNVSRDGDLVMLQGSIPTIEQKNAIAEAAAQANPEGEVLNLLKLSPETFREVWIDDLPAVVSEFLSNAPSGADLSVVDGKLILGGETGDQATYETLRDAVFEVVPVSLVMTDRLSVDGDRVKGEAKPSFVGPVELPKPEEKIKAEEKVNPETASMELVAAAENSQTALPEPTDERSVPIAEMALAAVPEGKEPFEKLVLAEPPRTVAAVEVVAKVESLPLAEHTEEPDPSPAPVEVDTSHEPDPGGPLIFYFDVASAEIRSQDRYMIDWIADRCAEPKTIVYITGYADYRGSYALNRKLTNQRTERVRDAIFASAGVAEDLKAELEAKGDEQSEGRDAWKSKDSEASLQYSRRVVVETYHLK